VLDAGGAAAVCFVPVSAATIPSGSGEMRIYRIACP